MFTPSDLNDLASDLARRAGMIQGEVDSITQTFGQAQWQGPGHDRFSTTEADVENGLAGLVALMNRASSQASTLATDYQNALNELVSIARGIKSWLTSKVSEFEKVLDVVTELVGMPFELLPDETSPEWYDILTTARRHGYSG